MSTNFDSNPDPATPRAGDARSLIVQAAESLPSDEKTAVLKAVGLPLPTTETTDKIWLIVISAFVTVFVACFGVIAYDLFNGKEGIDEKLITIFTTLSAFLAGLLVPSPVSNK